ncbi:MAG: flagellar motor protein MotB [Candidatus Cloacimonetes bacterium]|nr:flagellar motor protein MotB [Candidatus Cloacimonadota bacterium]
MAKAKKCPECPPVGAPGYMATYGDLMTLLVTFFVLLISFSSIQEAKFQKAIGSLQGALGVLKSSSGTSIVSPTIPMYEHQTEKVQFELERVLEQLRQMTEEQATSEAQISVEKSKDRIHFSISSPMLFDSGRAVLKPQSTPILHSIGEILAMVPFEVRVEGHTDNDQLMPGAQFRNNWELSAARALAVMEKFLSFSDLDIDPSRFQAIGYGEYHPLADNSSPEGKQLNRRVEIYVNLKSEISGSLIEQEILPYDF